MPRPLLLGFAAALLLTGCGASNSTALAPSPGGETPATAPAPATVGASAPAGVDLGAYPAIVRQAVTGLASELHVPAADVTVASVEGVSWPDRSLGCPEPGMSYAQVVVPGYRVVASVRGMQYTLHTDRSQTALRCTESGGVAHVAARYAP